jgi:NAD(P)-dependent dehydrogenase (short-subunit alcohol dehydrogenase family)
VVLLESKKDIFARFSLQGKTAIVTGASRGIGEEIAHILAQAGAHLIICSRKQQSLEEVATLITDGGGEVLPVAANVSVAADRKALIEKAMAWAGRVDILVNNAGANPSYGPLADLAESSWDKVFEVNLKACFFLSQLVFQAWMKDNGGNILNISSLAAFLPTHNINAYSVSKAALNHLTRCLANEWGKNNVRVNALAPGLIKTNFSRALWEDPKAMARTSTHPIPRFGSVDDIPGTALLLVSDAASFITGQTLIIDGGEIIK